jgi:tRNA(adenine34) deaminase
MVFDESVRSDDELYMREALLEAEQAALAGEVPVGALVVRDGEIISRAHNLVETMKSSSAHAEMLALAAAEEKLGAKWLTGCTVYVTLEPCSMCAGAMVLARISRLVIGAMDPKAGACGSVCNIAANEKLNHRIDIETGVLGEECSLQLKEFFRARRDKQ